MKDKKYANVDLKFLPKIKKTTKENEKKIIKMLMEDNKLALRYLEDK
ncbi:MULTISPECIES: hypothetical protein [Campylobacter]|nr:hypothetical protein [Campylobacter insulaenigrae]EGK8077134.1 hypothetical protein [Campylobacter lari]MCR8683891.1 hypothetical protein [Campylobacter sp. LMG 17559]EGK8097811.1 hypothetical protein [Campylobacter lari]EHZ4886179.1 hypothetical protein [Campylobacter lari]MCR6588534.1 hypothetical protein [Campylobacter insulaenigrae]